MKGDDTVELRRRRRKGANNTEVKANAYYAACSRRSALLKWAFVAALAVFLFIMLAVYHSNITYDNLKYLLRDLSSDRSGISADFTDVSFESQSSLDALIFKGELAVAGSSSVTLYNSTGEKTFDYKSGMENPVAQATDKYLFVFDLGGTHYSIFSNLTRVLDADADAVIENASMSEKGSFVIVKRARDAKYTVAVYDTSFKNKVNYYKSRFVADAALSPDGKTLVTVTVANDNAVISSLIELYDFGAEQPKVTVPGTGYLPIKVDFFEDGSFALICDTRIVFFDKNGAEITTYYQQEKRLTCSDAASSSLCAVYSGNITGFVSDIIIFDNRGNIIYNIETDQKLSDISHNDGYIFALGAGSAVRFDRADSTSRFEKCDADARIIVAAEDFALVISDSKASSVFGSTQDQNEPETEAPLEDGGY